MLTLGLLAYFAMAAVVGHAALNRNRPLRFWWALWHAITWPTLYLPGRRPPPRAP